MRTIILSLMLLLALPSFAASYKLDPAHSQVGFAIKHLVISTVRGNFNKFEGTFDFDEKSGVVSKVDVKIDSTSINTNDKKRDEHLNSPDFFDTKKHPEIRFKSDKGAAVKKDQTVKISGDLTMRGVTKPVTMDLTYLGTMTDAWGNEKVGFSLRGKVNRKDFGINWNKALDRGGMTLADDVVIEIEGQATKEKAAAVK